MDPIKNPYAPGAGYPPPELAGRDETIRRAGIALERIKEGRAARSVILYGLRGVGKTVLLHRIRQDADKKGFVAVVIEAPEDRSLPALLGMALRTTLIKMSFSAKAKDCLKRAKAALSSFVSAAKVKYDDLEFTMDFDGQRGLADSGDLESDLTDLIIAVGEAARESETVIYVMIDELQYVAEHQLAALITAFHRANQQQLPVTLIAAGLPQLLGQLGKAKSYAERLFEFIPVAELNNEYARQALCKPAEHEGVLYEEGAVQEILTRTEGYPYFIQEWGKHVWEIAENSPITREDAEKATQVALAQLDASFFRVRFDRLTPGEKVYMRAMAELGPGPHRSGDVAEKLGKKVNLVAPVRNRLINKGMAYSPNHGDIAFTVPLFDGFMKRIIPDLQP